MWYAIQVVTGQEEKVKTIIEEQVTKGSIRLMIYRRKLRERKQGQWHMVERKMFPGYILMETEMTDDLWQSLKQVETSFRVLKNDDDYLCLSESEVRVLGLLDGDGDGLVDVSELYVDGDKVLVKSGALVGQEASIIKIDKRKGRAKVKLNFCGSPRVIELGIEVLEKV